MYCKINRSNLSIAEKANQLIIQYKSYKKPTKNPHRIDLPLSFRTVIMVLAFYPQHIGKKNALRGKMHLSKVILYKSLTCTPFKFGPVKICNI